MHASVCVLYEGSGGSGVACAAEQRSLCVCMHVSMHVYKHVYTYEWMDTWMHVYVHYMRHVVMDVL